MEKLVADLLARQDPTTRHTLVTRAVISFVIVVGELVLCGFYGLMVAVAAYLLGVELMGLALGWAFVPIFVALFIGLVRAARSIKDYWTHYGHG